MINPTSMRTREVWTLPIDQIEPNTFNPNTMTKETYNALLEDIKENGLDIVDPILVSEKAVFYGTKDSGFVIVDGFHRWKAAKELGLSDIPATIKLMTEAEAKTVNYRKNKERGSLDPFLEGQLFLAESKAGLSRSDIGTKFGVSKTHVQRRITLVEVKPEIEKIVQSIKKEITANIEEFEKDIAEAEESDGVVFGNMGYRKRQAEQLRAQLKDLGNTVIPPGLTPSHIEEVIVLKTPEKRAEAIATILEDKSSVANTRERVQRLRQDEEKEALFKKAVEESSHRKCPVCKAEAESTAWESLPWVKCAGQGGYMNHTFSLDSGLTQEQEAERDRKQHLKDHPEEAAEKKKEAAKKFEPKSFRYPMTKEDIRVLLAKRIIKKVAAFDTLQQIRVTGKQGEKSVSIELSSDFGVNMYYSEDKYTQDEDTWTRLDIESTSFGIEPKIWKTDNVNKVKINCNTTNKAEMQKIKTFLDDL